MNPPDLEELYGDRLRVEYEESYYTERTRRSKVEPWLMTIPCQYGHVCPWGENLLAACTDKNGGIARRLMKLDFVLQDQSQQGADGVNAVFPIEHAEEVFKIIKPRKRRKGRPMSEEEKRQLADRGRAALARRQRVRAEKASQEASGGAA
jgi:hypothetical protein